MIALFALVPFILTPILLDWSALQAASAALMALALLLFMGERVGRISLQALPWLFWPLFMFARTSAQSELFSEWSLRLFVWASLAWLVFTYQDKSQTSRLWVLVFGLVALIVQLIGVLRQAAFLSQNSIYAQENVYQFMNVCVLSVALWVLLFDSCKRIWKGIALLVIVGVIGSLLYGDTFREGVWNISAGDSIGVWLALICGSCIAWFFNFMRKKFGSVRFAIFIAFVLLFLWTTLPFILVNLNLWHKGMNSSITSRLVFWSASWEMLKSHWLLGVGNGAFGANIQNYWPDLSRSLYHFWSFPIAAHSHFVHIAAENGLIGLVWNSVLWGIPWLCTVKKFFDDGNARTLFWLWLQATVLSAMVVLEVTQMFFAAQTAAWVINIYAVRLCSFTNTRAVAIKKIWLWLFVPFVCLLMWDRGGLLYSRILSTPTENLGRIIPEELAHINKSIAVSSKNAPALYYVAELQRLDGKYEDAWNTVHQLELISGTQWPIHRLRAEIMWDKGDTAMACMYAQWPVHHSMQKLDQQLKLKLPCHW